MTKHVRRRAVEEAGDVRGVGAVAAEQAVVAEQDQVAEAGLRALGRVGDRRVFDLGAAGVHERVGGGERVGEVGVAEAGPVERVEILQRGGEFERVVEGPVGGDVVRQGEARGGVVVGDRAGQDGDVIGALGLQGVPCVVALEDLVGLAADDDRDVLAVLPDAGADEVDVAAAGVADERADAVDRDELRLQVRGERLRACGHRGMVSWISVTGG